MSALTGSNKDARAWVEDYLASHPGSKGPQIVAAARVDPHGFSRSSVYRILEFDRAISRADGRYWIGRIEDPELAVAAEVERLPTILGSKQFSDSAKVQAAGQLGRNSAAAAPRSRSVVDLIEAAAPEPREVREALLPFVQHAVRAALQGDRVDAGNVRNLWRAAWALVDPFLRESTPAATVAWNTMSEAVEVGNLLADEDCLGIANLAIDIELHDPLSPPSAARAVLRRIARDDRFRRRLRIELLKRLSASPGKTQEERLHRLFRDLDLPPSPAATGTDNTADSLSTRHP